jgi:hypothetical protein
VTEEAKQRVRESVYARVGLECTETDHQVLHARLFLQEKLALLHAGRNGGLLAAGSKGRAGGREGRGEGGEGGTAARLGEQLDFPKQPLLDLTRRCAAVMRKPYERSNRHSGHRTYRAQSWRAVATAGRRATRAGDWLARA